MIQIAIPSLSSPSPLTFGPVSYYTYICYLFPLFATRFSPPSTGCTTLQMAQNERQNKSRSTPNHGNQGGDYTLPLPPLPTSRQASQTDDNVRKPPLYVAKEIRGQLPGPEDGPLKLPPMIPGHVASLFTVGGYHADPSLLSAGYPLCRAPAPTGLGGIIECLLMRHSQPPGELQAHHGNGSWPAGNGPV
jgi:hypothetical protein